jgi:hypothetical protein
LSDENDLGYSKRARIWNKMIRLHRRDGLKVLRLRRNGDSVPAGKPDGEKPEPEVAPTKKWLTQEKQRFLNRR